MSKFTHGGHTKQLAERAGLPESRLLDFPANINPLGPPEWVRAVVSSSMESVVNYPDPHCSDLKNAVASRYQSQYEEVLDSRYFRVAVRTAQKNYRLVESLRGALGLTAKTRKKTTRPVTMFQGTSSNAGKSILTAALGRILLQDGYRVAPFKSQNMLLNSSSHERAARWGAPR